jgi:enoyl-CoA hydratase/carnithine racemase
MVGAAHVKDLMFTGRLVDAAEASALGLVTRMAEPDAIEAAVGELAQTIANNAPLTIRATKEALRRIQRNGRLESGAIDDLVVACYTSEDFRNAVAAFLAKVPPTFKGK